MEFIRQFPERIQGLILISTRPGVDKPEGRENRLKMAERVEKEGVAFLASTMIPGLLGKTTLSEKPGIAEQVDRWIQGTNPAAVALAQRAMANRGDQTDLMAQIRVRTLVMAGVEDVLIPFSEAQLMAKALSNAQLKLFQGVGHLIPLEDSQEFQKSFDSFVEH